MTTSTAFSRPRNRRGFATASSNGTQKALTLTLWNIPTPQEMLLARLNEFTSAIRLLMDAKHTLPTIVMLYAAIDFLGSLSRPESEADTKGAYFKKWAGDFMLVHSQAKFTAEDLWGARCGLLHTHTASSKLSRKGAARQLQYFRGPLPLPMKKAMRLVEQQGEKIFVDVDILNEAFERGVRRFLDALQRDSNLQKRVLRHSSNLFGTWTHGG